MGYAACDVGGASSGSDDKNDLDDNIKIEALRRMIKREVQSKRLQGGCRALIFCDAKRDMESMAIILENDLNGLKTSMSIEETPKRLKVVVSVLRYDDPVMDRSAAMDAFLGGDGRRKYQNFNYGSSSSSSSSSSDSEDEDNNEDASEDRNVNDDNDDDDDDDDDDEDIVLRIMLATDLAARGLDVADITHIFNYDLPRDGDCYVHRAGRAGRLGKKRRKRNVDDGEGNGNVNDNKSIIKKGVVMSLVTSRQEFVLERLANELGLEVKCIARQKKGEGLEQGQGRRRKPTEEERVRARAKERENLKNMVFGNSPKF